MSLGDEIERTAASAAAFASPGEQLAGVVPVEPSAGLRLYLCGFTGDDAPHWLVLDDAGRPVQERRLVREAASIAALCELADETAAGGDLDELRSHLVALRITENPPGIDEAEEAVLALQAAIGAPPRLATPEHLDRVGAATRRVELTFGDESGSPFAAAMRHAGHSAQAFVSDVEENYKLPLE